MKDYKLHIIIFLILPLFILSGCTEAYPLITNRYEEAIVVQATITNELKNQEIKITKTARFEDENYLPENGAEVYITDNSGNRYDFEDQSDRYVSKLEFQALPDVKYQLHVNTKDDRSFESSIETLSPINPMQNVKAEVETKDNVRGVAIRVNSFDSSNQSKYYRYEYEETYKIVTPKWVTLEAYIDEKGALAFRPNSTDTKVCFGNKKSPELLLTNTSDSNEDRVNFLIRFISDQDYIITTRYSILVRQYVESLAAYTYYNTLKKMSSSESILSPNQPGFLVGNLKSIKNPNSKIVGYFDVASVSTERIYFNYGDLFPNKPAPPYYTDCQEFCYSSGLPPPPDGPCSHTEAGAYIQDLELNKISYFLEGGYYYWVDSPCGDCTTFASNLRPTFWVD